jgi:hypothetical protein
MQVDQINAFSKLEFSDDAGKFHKPELSLPVENAKK